MQERLSGAVMNTLHMANISGKGALDLQITGRSKNFLHKDGGRELEGGCLSHTVGFAIAKNAVHRAKNLAHGYNHHTSRSDCETVLERQTSAAWFDPGWPKQKGNNESY